MNRLRNVDKKQIENLFSEKQRIRDKYSYDVNKSKKQANIQLLLIKIDKIKILFSWYP